MTDSIDAKPGPPSGQALRASEQGTGIIQKGKKGPTTKPNKKRDAIEIVFKALTSWRISHGDYLEFGVFAGRAFVEAYRAAVRHRFDSMRFFAFDSFKGLPPPSEEERLFNHFFEGQYACSKEMFVDNLRQDGVDLGRVTIVPGFFNESLTHNLKNELNIARASVVFIDCDLYESTAPVLEFITDIIDTGTLLVFDDWFSFSGSLHTGEIKATNEWLSKNPHIRLEYYRDFSVSGRIFVVQKVRPPET